MKSIVYSQPGQTRPAGHRRRGATMVEGAVVLGVFVTMLLGMLDISLAYLRKNMLTEGAHRAAREAMVHGSLAAPEDTVWGPATYTGTANDDTEIAAAVRPALATIDPALATIEVVWPDGGNEPGQRVKVTISYQHQSLLPFIYGDSLNLEAKSVMRIAH